MTNTFCKVLLVDDEINVRTGIRLLLNWEQYGFQLVGEASNGKEALEMIDKHHPHIILCDIVMPLMDGLELSQKLRSVYPDIKIIILSSFDNFEYVKGTLQQGAIDYILKPTINEKVLLMALQKAASQIEGLVIKTHDEKLTEAMVSQFIFGYCELDQLNALTNYLSQPVFCVLVVNCKVHFTAKIKETLSDERLIQVFGQMISVPIIVEHDCSALLINFDRKNFKHLVTIVESFSEWIRKTNDASLLIISEPIESLHDVKEKYHLLKDLLQKRFYLRGQHFIKEHGFIKTQKAPEFDSETFSSLLNSCDFNESMKMFLKYIDSAISVHQTNELEIKVFASSMIYMIVSRLDEMGFDNSISLKFGYFDEIHKPIFAQDFRHVVHHICEKLQTLLSDYFSEYKTDTIRAIIDYINQHSADPLSLHQIAKQFNFNYNYLSTVLNLHIEGGFNEYLNGIRIGKAMQLLRNSSYSISEIAMKVGYSDVSYFGRVFKKKEGCTPSRYRRGIRFNAQKDSSSSRAYK